MLDVKEEWSDRVKAKAELLHSSQQVVLFDLNFWTYSPKCANPNNNVLLKTMI